MVRIAIIANQFGITAIRCLNLLIFVDIDLALPHNFEVPVVNVPAHNTPNRRWHLDLLYCCVTCVADLRGTSINLIS